MSLTMVSHLDGAIQLLENSREVNQLLLETLTPKLGEKTPQAQNILWQQRLQSIHCLYQNTLQQILTHTQSKDQIEWDLLALFSTYSLHPISHISLPGSLISTLSSYRDTLQKERGILLKQLALFKSYVLCLTTSPTSNSKQLNPS